MELNKYSKENAANHLNQYIEYCNLVGDNGGVMMSEKEYEQYKKNHAKISENRLFTTWYNVESLACKVVGASSKCFCDHPYKNHDYLQGKGNKVKCKFAGCKCLDYYYIPIYGSQDFKCSCKHSYQNHDVAKKNCKNCPCKAFQSTWSCNCGFKFGEHKTISEHRKEKQEKGETVHNTNGGIVSYSSMLPGAQRVGYGINEQMKKKGLKVAIEDFSIPKNLELLEQISAWDLAKKPLTWLK